MWHVLFSGALFTCWFMRVCCTLPPPPLHLQQLLKDQVEQHNWLIQRQLLHKMCDFFWMNFHVCFISADFNVFFFIALCFDWLFSQPAHLSSAPMGVPTTQRSPITVWLLTPSLCIQPVKVFLVFRLFSLLFFLLPFLKPLEPWTDGKIVAGRKSASKSEWELEEAMQSHCLMSWTTGEQKLFCSTLTEPQRDQAVRQDSLRGKTATSSPQLWRTKPSRGRGECRRQRQSQSWGGELYRWELKQRGGRRCSERPDSEEQSEVSRFIHWDKEKPPPGQKLLQVKQGGREAKLIGEEERERQDGQLRSPAVGLLPGIGRLDRHHLHHRLAPVEAVVVRGRRHHHSCGSVRGAVDELCLSEYRTGAVQDLWLHALSGQWVQHLTWQNQNHL